MKASRLSWFSRKTGAGRSAPAKPRGRPALECLEDRMLMAASLGGDGLLRITGDDGGVVRADDVRVGRSGQNVEVRVNGQVQLSLPAAGLVQGGQQVLPPILGISIDGRGGDDTVTVDTNALRPLAGAGGTPALLQGVIVNGGTGTSDTLVIDDQANTAATNSALVQNRVLGLLPGNGFFLNNLDGLTVRLGGGADRVNVQSLGTLTRLETGAGTDTVTAGSNGLLGGIAGRLEVVGGADFDTLNVNDSNNLANDSFGIAPSFFSDTPLDGGSVSFLTGRVDFGGTEAVNVTLGGGANDVRVLGTTAGVVTTLNTGGGGDTVRIVPAIEFSGGPDSIRGVLIVDGGVGTGTDRLVLDDSDDTAANLGQLTGDRITGLGMGPSGIVYRNLEVLSITLGRGDDQFVVTETARGTATSLDTGAGADTVGVGLALGAPSGRLEGIRGRLTLDGGAEPGGEFTDRLLLDDGGDFDRGGAASFNPATGVGAVTGLGSAGVTFRRFESVRVRPGPGAGVFDNNAPGVVTVI